MVVALVVQGKLLDADSDSYKKTVAEMGIRADSTLYLRVNKGDNEDGELESALWEQLSQEDVVQTPSYRPEQGFKGTVLTQGPWRPMDNPRAIVDMVDDDDVVEVVRADNDAMSVTAQAVSRRPASELPVQMVESPPGTPLPYNIVLLPPELDDDMEQDSDSEEGQLDIPEEDDVTMSSAAQFKKAIELTSRLSDQLMASCRNGPIYDTIDRKDVPF